MQESDTQEKIIKAIKEEEITPRPKWFFVARNYFIWFFAIISSLLGATALGFIVFLLTTQDWEAHEYLGRSILLHIFFSVPYFWLIALAVFLAFAYYEFRKTKKGYVCETCIAFSVIVFVVIFAGIFFLLTGFNSRLHESFSNRIPAYRALIYDKDDIWNNPKNGLIGGRVLEIIDEKEFNLKDHSGNVWRVEDGTAVLPKDFSIKKDEKLRITGDAKAGNIFMAKSIKPW